MNRYAGIVINNSSKNVDRLFTYIIPNHLDKEIQIGNEVVVPFGKGNKPLEGFVLEIYEDNNEVSYECKEILKICSDIKYFDEESIELIEYMRKEYLATYLEAVKTLIPSGYLKGTKNKTKSILVHKKELTGKYLKENYILIIEDLKKEDKKYSKGEFAKEKGHSLSSINTLIRNGFVEEVSENVKRYTNKKYDDYLAKSLNSEQEDVKNSILNGEKSEYLIHGVTGSGKTEIYLSIAEDAIKCSKEVIMLIPEISLTSQTVERFKGRFGDEIAIFHSMLSSGERFDQWMRVFNGEVKIAVGVRSAIFLPFKNLGYIIIDEEHDTSYKSWTSPKYDTREIASLRVNFQKAKLILGSATPSLRSYLKAKENEIEYLEIKNRATSGTLPEVIIVDMKKELENGNKNMLSRELYKSIKESLSKKEQVIMFINRRGYSGFISCRKCGYVYKCPNCDISLNYHMQENKLICHYCGYVKIPEKTCPKCESRYIKLFSAGTEKVESELKKYFKDSKIIRMDFDTTRKKGEYDIIYEKFKNGEADILVGTQMVAKGFDFPNVTLVGVVSADISLNIPDYKSHENTFQLLTQVSGRAGRGTSNGKVIIQTYESDNPSIVKVKNKDEKGFYENELEMRKMMDYPPYSKLFLIGITSTDMNDILKFSSELKEVVDIILSREKTNGNSIKILGPAQSVVGKINKRFRWQIILKGKISTCIMSEIRNIIVEMTRIKYKNIKISLDVNPNNMI